MRRETINAEIDSDIPQLIEQVTAQAHQGDTGSIEAAFVLYHEAIERVVERRFGADKAQDIVQDTFVKVMTAIPEGKFEDRGKNSLRSWLFTIACRTGLDQIRREKHTKAADVDVYGEASYGALPSSHNVEEEAIINATAREMLSVLEDEPVFWEAMLEMGLRDEHYTDFAARKGISAATARTRLHRARTKLHERLLNYEE